MCNNRGQKTEILDSFRSLLNERCYSTQQQLANELSLQGFSNVTQTKVSRMIKHLGAVKKREFKKASVYHLPIKTTPQAKQHVGSIVHRINHNHVQIIIKTAKAGAILIAQLIEQESERLGVLGCIASDNTLLVIPSKVDEIDNTVQLLIQLLNFNGY
jgi:transcriptional regulator of arginine metabolism